MATRVVLWLFYLLRVGLICNTILPYSQGLPQLADVLFPDTIRLCRGQQGGRNCPGGGGGNPQASSRGGACSGRRATTQNRHQSPGQGCNLLQGNVLWPGDTSRCAQVLSRGPCPQGQWVILSNNIAEESICAPRLPCVGADAVMMDGKCYHRSDNSICPPTMTIQTNEFGNGECECQAGTIYHQHSNRCYTPYSQGPCPTGFIIKAVDLGDRSTSECVRNPCPDQNMAPLDQQCIVANGISTPGQCHRINTAGPCNNGILSIDGTSAEPGCSDRSIFSGGIPCRRGSKKDQQGRCRKVFTGIRRPQNQNQRPISIGDRQQQNKNPRCRENQLLLGGGCIPRG